MINKERIKALMTSTLPVSLLTLARREAVCALTYHRINGTPSLFPGMAVDAFRQQMIWLRRRCVPLSADEFAGSLDAGRGGKPRVLVTFDDGYRDFHDVAYPILDELRIPCLVFIATSFIGGTKLIWTDVVDAVAHRTEQRSAHLPGDAGQPLPLQTPAHRSQFALRTKQRLKALSDHERRAALAALLAELRVPRPNELVPRQMLNWDEVRATMPLATFGGHSHEHPILASLGDAEQDADLRTCTDTMRRELGVAPRYFAYPNGTRDDFTPVTAALLQKLGYQLAFTTIPGLNGPASDRYALRRQYTTCASISDFAWQVVGGATLLHRGVA